MESSGHPPAGPTAEVDPPAFGRPSPASSAEPRLAARGGDGAWRADGGSTDWCCLRAATVVGTRHRLAGHPPEDAYAWQVERDRIAIAVSDGLGAVERSGPAARRAAVAAVEAAASSRDEPAIAVADGMAAANAAAEGGGATTVVVAVVDRSGEVALARVGDSTAFEVDAGGGWLELFEPPDKDRTGTATSALPDAEPAVELVTGVLTEGAVVALLTDGVADPWRDGPTTAAPTLAAGVLASPSPLGLAQLADFSRQGCHDDRTIVSVRLLAVPAADQG